MTTPRRSPAGQTPSSPQHTPEECLEQVWLLRAAVRGGDMRRFCREDAELEERLELAGITPEVSGMPAPAEIARQLAQRLEALESTADENTGRLAAGARRFGRILRLTALETRILQFAALLHDNDRFGSALDFLGELNARKLTLAMAAILRTSRAAVERCLRPGQPLSAFGLVTIDTSRSYAMRSKLDIAPGVVDCLYAGEAGLQRLLARYHVPAPAPNLRREDFDHLGEEWAHVRALVHGAVSAGRPGCNVLTYGEPGIGKTEFVRAMAAEAGFQLFEVSADGSWETPLTGSERLAAYRVTQRVLERRGQCLVLFDEAEDVFPVAWSSPFGPVRRSGEGKAHTNRLLEENPVPTLWTSNAVGQIDPAHVRRFDYVVKLPAPPRSARQRLIRTAAAGFRVTDDWVDRMAAIEAASPAHIEAAARVGMAVAGSRDPAGAGQYNRFEAAFEKAMEGALRAVGLRYDPPARTSSALPYEPSLSNTQPGLHDVARGLAQAPQARILLHGPPGTGKTGFARWIAQHLDRPLLCRSASDLLGPYVGETEANIAAMFRAAQESPAVLLLDEADGFLQDRRDAHRHWEVTQVNELLTGMENFPGVFICATNLVDQLDQASFRRFDLRIRFDYLRPAQASRLLHALAQRTATSATDDDDARRADELLRGLCNLTPADFGLVERSLRFGPRPGGLADLVLKLKEIADAKVDRPRRVVGFRA